MVLPLFLYRLLKIFPMNGNIFKDKLFYNKTVGSWIAAKREK